MPGIPEKEQRYFTPEEVNKIIDAAEGQYRPLFALQFATGMRFGEIAGLHVEHIDFEQSVIRIRRSTYRLQEVTPKSQAGHRPIDVDPDTMTMLKDTLPIVRVAESSKVGIRTFRLKIVKRSFPSWPKGPDVGPNGPNWIAVSG